jgi:hypothetical protein
MYAHLLIMPVNPVKLRLRRDTYANWAGVGNVLVLAPGEPSVILPSVRTILTQDG